MRELQKVKQFDLPVKEVSKGKNKGNLKLKLENEQIWNKIVEKWDLNIATPIIRNMFKNTSKYKSGKDSFNIVEVLIKEWNKLKLGEISWPFSQGKFDDFVQSINSEDIDGFSKDNKVKEAAVKFRRIKEINTVRNDFIETLIFEKNKNILPTLEHIRNVDFFINGFSYDQKVAKSPTKEFKTDYGK